MPCRPTDADLEYDRVSLSLVQLEGRWVDARAALTQMVTVARRFSPLDDAEQELEAAWRMSQGLETPPAFSGDPLGGLLERERWLQKAVSDAELSACILGCALVRTVGALQFDDRDLHTALEAHRRHRRQERTERVAELRAARRDDEARALEELSEAVLFSRRKSLFGAAG